MPPPAPAAPSGAIPRQPARGRIGTRQAEIVCLRPVDPAHEHIIGLEGDQDLLRPLRLLLGSVHLTTSPNRFVSEMI
jgi:hypothetical protein